MTRAIAKAGKRLWIEGFNIRYNCLVLPKSRDAYEQWIIKPKDNRPFTPWEMAEDIQKYFRWTLVSSDNFYKSIKQNNKWLDERFQKLITAERICAINLTYVENNSDQKDGAVKKEKKKKKAGQSERRRADQSERRTDSNRRSADQSRKREYQS
eukprot:TRINITY_DN7870_c0_g1_i1.p1 TRINITY_DN7870_c0_g1~~TRINITY_DN7870_c0_g1_i1.p1  ORF type:complete len:154 (-),score=17.67 TRINITY_DN7870_c0_g1_i1:111-572(-)